ncbi:MAG: HEPN domain-containing protein [Roseburia sp.]|nr:HEPN domain-containing protein [Roseburia sp.]MCM1242933.1 HEPN domain-containing protein [Roseburia sp.]
MEDRNLDLTARNEDTRDKFHTKVIRFEIDQIMQHFTETIQAINAQFDVADELHKSGKVLEGENIWRAQIVFLASAFDFYMHELTKYGLCEIYNENWNRTDKYDNLQINMKVIEVALKSGEDIDWFLEYINGYYRVITMVSYESVKDQFNLLGIDLGHVADRAFYQRGGSEGTKYQLKRRLNELFTRRNIIAHQADRSHTDAQIKNITKEIGQKFICDVEKIVNSIDAEVRNK